MITKVIMPMLGWTMKEGTVVTWLKKEGERVEEGESLFVVETEKVEEEIESPGTGVLRKILISEGCTVPVTEILAVIAEPEEEIPDLDKMIERAKELIMGVPKAPAVEMEAPKALAIEKIERPMVRKPAVELKISPAAKKLAEDHGIDLSRVKGTGPEGRIVREDVLAAIEMAKIMPRVKEAIPLKGIRKTIAERLSHSYRTAVHVRVGLEVDMSEMVKLRQKLLPEIEKKANVRVTYTDMLVKVAAKTLEEYPIVNSTLEGEEIKILENINIGVAVDTEAGLIVPVVRDANKKSLVEVALTTKELVEKARSGKLSLDEVTGGTFTVTNLGMFGIDEGAPVINPPEIAILGVGRIAEKPVAVEGNVVIRPMMNIGLSFDHRVIDGVLAARFLQSMKEKLEKPSNLFESA